VDVNTRGEGNWTGLMCAAMMGHEEVVEVLLAQPGVELKCGSVDADGVSVDGVTVLHLACQQASTGIVRRLLAMPGVEVEARDGLGRTPLMLAVVDGNEKVVRVLVEVEGIDLDTRDNHGNSLEDAATLSSTKWFPVGTESGIKKALGEAKARRVREIKERRMRREAEVWSRDMAQCLASLLESAPTTGDFTLVCQGEEVACHTNILVAMCPTLAQGALSTMREGEERRWVVRSMEGEEVGVEVVRDLLTFIYTGTISEERVQERVEELLELAHMYQLAGLVDTCREAALQQITVDNSLHTLATLHKLAMVDGEDEQRKVAVRFVQRNLARVMGTKDWQAFTSSLPDLVEEVEGGRRARERVDGEA